MLDLGVLAVLSVDQVHVLVPEPSTMWVPRRQAAAAPFSRLFPAQEVIVLNESDGIRLGGSVD